MSINDQLHDRARPLLRHDGIQTSRERKHIHHYTCAHICLSDIIHLTSSACASSSSSYHPMRCFKMRWAPSAACAQTYYYSYFLSLSLYGSRPAPLVFFFFVCVCVSLYSHYLLCGCFITHTHTTVFCKDPLLLLLPYSPDPKGGNEGEDG